MCRAVTCSTCGKTTWAGCGAHVEQVMAGVPAAQRCRCNEGKKAGSSTPAASEKGLLAKLFGL
jgi:hypothetical protein